MSKARQLAQKPTQPTGRKNFLINADMRINQRGDETGHSGAAYILDRWETSMYNTGSGTVDVSRATDAPSGFTKSMKFDVNAADSSQDANAQMYIEQQIEAQNIDWLKFYEANPDTVTISFWVKSNLTGSFSATLKLSDNNSSHVSSSTRVYNFTYSISAADTWEKKTKTITLDSSTSETKATGNNFGMSLAFWLAAGSSRDGVTADTWANNGNATCDSDNLDLFASASNNWYVTGVQIEAGSVATEFEHRSYGEELQLCQRYYIRYPSQEDGSPYLYYALGLIHNTNTIYYTINLPVPMRVQPDLEISGAAHFTSVDSGTVRNLTNLTIVGNNFISNKAVAVAGTGSSLTAHRPSILRGDGTSGGFIAFEAEL